MLLQPYVKHVTLTQRILLVLIVLLSQFKHVIVSVLNAQIILKHFHKSDS